MDVNAGRARGAGVAGAAQRAEDRAGPQGGGQQGGGMGVQCKREGSRGSREGSRDGSRQGRAGGGWCKPVLTRGGIGDAVDRGAGGARCAGGGGALVAHLGDALVAAQAELGARDPGVRVLGAAGERGRGRDVREREGTAVERGPHDGGKRGKCVRRRSCLPAACPPCPRRHTLHSPLETLAEAIDRRVGTGGAGDALGRAGVGVRAGGAVLAIAITPHGIRASGAGGAAVALACGQLDVR